jgi:hypothetical protein
VPSRRRAYPQFSSFLYPKNVIVCYRGSNHGRLSTILNRGVEQGDREVDSSLGRFTNSSLDATGFRSAYRTVTVTYPQRKVRRSLRMRSPLRLYAFPPPNTALYLPRPMRKRRVVVRALTAINASLRVPE